jgi:mono/diheme cytochrome c family protein
MGFKVNSTVDREELMRQISRLVAATVATGFIATGLPDCLRAQNDAEKIYRTHCVLCHAPDGSGSSPSGKALKAEDLRSDVVQKKSDAELTAAITNGKGKMPAFGKKLKPDDIAKLVAFIRAMPKK